GSVANIQKAFHLKLLLYQHPKESRAFYAPDVEPSLELSVPVLHIGGLENYVLPHPSMLHRHFDGPRAVPQLGSGPFGTYIGYDFRAAYAPGVPLDGAGQIVGLLQFDGFIPTD